MTLGIRGSNIEIVKQGIEAIVEYTEIVEADLIIHVLIEDKETVIIEKYKPDQPIPYLNGQMIHISFDEDSFHLFNQEGKRI